MQTRVTSAGDLTGAVVPEGAPKLPTRISWGAVLAGGLVAVVIGAMLNILGVAVGASTIDPVTAGETPSAESFSVWGAAWMLLANLIGLACGGYVAARLSGTSDDTDGILHGLSVWAVGFLVSAVVLGNVAAGAAGQVAGFLGQAARGAGEAVSQITPEAVDPSALVGRLQQALQSRAEPGNMTPDQRRVEMGRIIAERATSDRLAPPARDRLSALAAAEFGIPAEEATRRINELETEATRLTQEAERTARAAADAAAKAAAVGAYWVFATMLLGAAAAVLGSRIGTRAAVLVASRRVMV